MSSPQSALPSTKDVVNRVFGDVKEYSKLVSQIPSEDYDYHQAFPAFRKQVEEQSAVLVQMMDSCTRLLPKRRRVTLSETASAAAGGLARSAGVPPPSSPVQIKLTEVQRTAVMEAIDSLLENVDTVLDDLRGRKMRSADQLSVTFGSELTSTAASKALSAAADGAGGLLHVAHVMRPQLSFDTEVDNSDAPFVPVYYDAHCEAHTGVAGVHPFADVIRETPIPQDQLLPRADTPAIPLQTCPLTFVDTPDDLQRMVDELMLASEIAVDLEHHDFYSYQGFTCLMQISTRSADYIVDCLKLRSSMKLLSPVFLNPQILKVFHGAREDVRWLQKDFGLYLINFFDTGIALQTLHMPYSLAFAVDHFCQVKLNKKYQTADWRVRPLSAEMVHYARQDTHYLLYVYDRLKALLLNSEGRASVGNLLLHVYNESRRLSLEVYDKPHLSPNESYKAALGRSLGGLSAVQERVARDVFNWRDAAAREADDSPTAVLHLSSVLAIASKLPTTAKDLLRCCSPVSVVVRRQVGHLVDIVKTALGEAETAAGKASATGAASTTEGHGVETAEEATSTTDGRADIMVFHGRPVGIHRPMTGTLPSVSTRLAPAVEQTLGAAAGDATALHRGAAYSLTGTTPSLWSVSMQQVAKSLAARPAQRVPLPGTELLAMMQAKAQMRLTEAAASEKLAREAEANQRKRARADSSSADENGDEGNGSEEGVSAKEAERQTCEGKEEGHQQQEESRQTEDQMTFPAGAFSMRQAFGTGAQDRKKVKTNPAKRGQSKKK